MQSVAMSETMSRIVTDDSDPLFIKQALQLYHKLDDFALLDFKANTEGVAIA